MKPDALPQGVTVRRVTAAETRPLRQQVLRPLQPVEDLVFPGDDDALAAHFAISDRGQVVGVASVCQEGCPDLGATENTWRVRGMAVVPTHRDQGLGAKLLEACLDHARTHGGDMVWCNARIGARRFYERHGFLVYGEAFDLPDIGTHFRMARKIQGRP